MKSLYIQVKEVSNRMICFREVVNRIEKEIGGCLRSE